MCIIQHIRRPPLKCKSLKEGKKGGVDARSRAILWGAWMMRGRKNQLTDGSVLQLERNDNANRGQRRDNEGSIKEGNRVMMMCFPGKSLIMDLME